MGGPSDSTLSVFDAGEARQSIVAQSGDYSLQVTVAIDLSGSMSTQSLTNLKVRSLHPSSVTRHHITLHVMCVNSQVCVHS